MNKQVINGIEYVEDNIPGKGACFVPRSLKSIEFLKKWLGTLPLGVLNNYSKGSLPLYVARTGANSFSFFYTDFDGVMTYNGNVLKGLYVNLTLEEALTQLSKYSNPNTVVDFITKEKK